MKKLALLCIAAIGVALLVFGAAPSASAYPELTCTVSVDRQILGPGESFNATGKTEAVSSDFQWSFKWNGVTKKRTGATASASFTAPKVASSRNITLTATSSASAGDCARHVDITVVVGAQVEAPSRGDAQAGATGGDAEGAGPTSGDAQVAGPTSSGAQDAQTGAAGGLLPDTGGPQFWFVVGGLALLLAGGAAVAAARRRS